MPDIIPTLSGVSYPQEDSSDSSLAAGVYWASGSVSLAPIEGNYTVTTLLEDGSAGDSTTGPTAAGVTSITTVHAIALGTISVWAQTYVFDGTGASSFSYWNGSSWTAITDTNGTGWTTHGASAAQSRTATFGDIEVSGPGAIDYVRCVFTSGENGPQATDSRPA